MFKAALFAIAVLGVNGAPFNELKVRQYNDTANSTTSEPEGHWTIFSPQTAKSQLTLDGPGGLTTYSPVPSPVTAITQLSLGIPESEDTETATQDYTSQTKQPKPIIQPTDISIIIPVTDADKTSSITIFPTAHVENSATYIFVPGPGTTSRSATPKMPHTEIAGSELEQPPAPTESPDTHDGDDDGTTPGPGATTTQPTQAWVIVGGETSSAGGSITSGSSEDDAEAHASPTFVVDNTPLVAGGSPITVSGTTYSLASTGSAVVVNGKTVSPASPTLIVDNTPLLAGGPPITVGGTTYSLAPTGSAVVVNGNTVSITTDSQGQIVPVTTGADASAGGSTDSATNQVLGGLSIVSADATTSSETAQETGSSGEQQTNGGESGTNGAASTASTTGGDAGATTTSGDSEPAVQSDNAGALNSPTWPIATVIGAIGLLAVVV